MYLRWQIPNFKLPNPPDIFQIPQIPSHQTDANNLVATTKSIFPASICCPRLTLSTDDLVICLKVEFGYNEDSQGQSHHLLSILQYCHWYGSNRVSGQRFTWYIWSLKTKVTFSRGSWLLSTLLLREHDGVQKWTSWEIFVEAGEVIEAQLPGPRANHRHQQAGRCYHCNQ